LEGDSRKDDFIESVFILRVIFLKKKIKKAKAGWETVPSK
jgi:hypothetical protein